MNTKETAIVNAVTARYLETGKASSAADIAKLVGFSASTVRKVMAGHGGTLLELDTYQDERRNANFGGGANHHRLWVHVPSRHTLRAIINAKTETAVPDAGLVATVTTAKRLHRIILNISAGGLTHSNRIDFAKAVKALINHAERN